MAIVSGISQINNTSLGKNLLIGGDFSINPWQRGTSFSTTTNGTIYTADKFAFFTSGPARFTIAQDTDVPTVAQSNLFLSNSIKISCTTAEASLASGSEYDLRQIIEGYNFSKITQKAFTLSFWVKSHQTGTFCVAVRNSGADRSYIIEYTVNSADTWEFKSMTFSASPTGGTWNYTNGSGLIVSFALAGGTSNNGTAGSWQSSNVTQTSNQTNGASSTSNIFRFAAIQIEEGSSVTLFEQRSIQQELELCLRYYEKSFDQGQAPVQAINGNTGAARQQQSNLTGSLILPVKFLILKRAAPTITTYNPVNSNAQAYNNSRGADCTSTTTTNAGTNGFTLTATPPGTTVNGDDLTCHWTADCDL